MAKHDLSLLGALVATRNLTPDDAFAIDAYCKHVESAEILPISLEAAIDSALEFFCPPADEAAAQDHNHDTCPDCGGPMDEDPMTDEDYHNAFELYWAVRNMIGADREEC